MYINGSHTSSTGSERTGVPDTGNWSVGRALAFSGSQGSQFTGEVDDIRVYNHVLSKKEIRELSKAKALHYTFDDFQEPTENIVTSPDMQNRSSADYQPIYGNSYEGGIALKNQSGNKSQYQLTNNIPITAGEEYTLTTRHYFSKDFDTGLRTSFCYEYSNGKHHNLFGSKKGEWETSSLTFTAETTGDMRAALYMSSTFTTGFVIID